MNVPGHVHHLDTELVFVQSDACDPLPVPLYDADRFIFLGELLGWFCQPPGQPAAGIAYGLDEGVQGPSRSYRTEVGPEPAALAFNHVARRAVPVTVEELFAMLRISAGFAGGFDLNAPEVGNNLPDFFVGHAHALSVGSIGGHGGTGDSLVDIAEEIRVRIAVQQMRPGKVGSAPAAASTKPVAESAVDAKLVLARLCRSGAP